MKMPMKSRAARPSKSSAPAKTVGSAKTILKAAISRHERHMSGKEPTSDASQMRMMKEMKSALGKIEKC